MNNDPRAPLYASTSLQQGAYVVESFLGMGGFGITYRAKETRLDRPVAIKEFFPRPCVRLGRDLTPDGKEWSHASLDDHRRKFLAEGQTLAALGDPGIVDIYSSFEENSTVYLVMKFLAGQTLRDYTGDQEGPLPVAEAVDLIGQVGTALIAVHRAGLLHRDIKPANIMRLRDGRVVLIDFGSARKFGSSAAYGLTAIKSQGYAPPEQYSAQGEEGPFTDVYALAATLYFLLTCEVPIESPIRLIDDRVQSPADLRPDVPMALSAAIMKGMHPVATGRFQTVTEFLAALQQALIPIRPLSVTPEANAMGAAPVKSCDPIPARPIPAEPDPMQSPPAEPFEGKVASALPVQEVRDEPEAGAVRTNPPDGATIVYVPSGHFLLGSTHEQLERAMATYHLARAAGKHETPQRSVYLDGYWIYEHPVTVEQYRRFCAAKNRKMPGAPSWGWQDDHPMVNVSWHDALAYAQWAGVTLPRETEWEKAARGVDGGVFPWGDERGIAGFTGLKSTWPVQDYAGTSPYGCRSMVGHVWQWCADWYDGNYYVNSPDRNPPGPPNGIYRVLRGGSWTNNDTSLLRCANRHWSSPHNAFINFGFRCVLRAQGEPLA